MEFFKVLHNGNEELFSVYVFPNVTEISNVNPIYFIYYLIDFGIQ